MLPNFLIIGTEKSATTWLAACLAEHPDVFLSREKELYFFSRRFDRGLPWYEAHFDQWSGEAAIGEATPVYLSHPDAPARIRKVLGDVRLIASVRHPVDRAYSAFWHNLRRGRIPLASDFRDCFARDVCEIRSRGYYFTHLARFLDYFPRDRLLVLVYEQMFGDGRRTIDECLTFLQVRAGFEPSALDTRINEGRKDIRVFNRQARLLRSTLRQAVLWGLNARLVPKRLQQSLITGGARSFNQFAYAWGPRARSYDRLDDGLRRELFETCYADEVARLERLLGRDLSLWDARPTAVAGATSPSARQATAAAGGSLASGRE